MVHIMICSNIIPQKVISKTMIEILIALFEEIMVNEDKFILSKAHASFPLCLVLKEKGLNPRMSTHLEIDPDKGIYCTSGSVGHGLPGHFRDHAQCHSCGLSSASVTSVGVVPKWHRSFRL